MMSKKILSGYFMTYVEENEVVIHYAESEELAHSYVFETEEEAEDFYHLCLKMGELAAEVTPRKQAATHQVLIKESLKGKKYQALAY